MKPWRDFYNFHTEANQIGWFMVSWCAISVCQPRLPGPYHWVIYLKDTDFKGHLTAGIAPEFETACYDALRTIFKIDDQDDLYSRVEDELAMYALAGGTNGVST